MARRKPIPENKRLRLSNKIVTKRKAHDSALRKAKAAQKALYAAIESGQRDGLTYTDCAEASSYSEIRVSQIIREVRENGN